MVALRAESNRLPVIHAESGLNPRYILFHPEDLNKSVYVRSQMVDGNVATKVSSSVGLSLSRFPVDLHDTWKRFCERRALHKEAPDLTAFFKK